MSDPLVNAMLASALVGMSEQASSLVEALEDSGTLDPVSGKVTLDISAVEAAVRRHLPDGEADAVQRELESTAESGFALLRSGTDRVRVAFPWRLLAVAAENDGGSAHLLPLLGFGAGATPESALAHLTEHLANVPANLSDASTVERLLERGATTPLPWLEPGTLLWSHAGVLSVCSGALPKKIPPPTVPPPKSPWEKLQEDAQRAARCLLAGDWRTDWWGWGVCLDHQCAELVASMLAVGGGLLITAVLSLSPAPPIPLIVAIMAAFSWALAINIRAVNGPNGACIQGTWPVLGPASALVWAKRW